MLREMAGLGFEHVELSHGIRIPLVPGILRAVEEGVVKVSSTHNFCPLPVGIIRPAPNLFEPSAADPREHAQWVRQTKRSIEFAAQVNARVLVCHLGSVRLRWFNPVPKLRRHLHEHPGAGRDATDHVYQARLRKAMNRLRQRREAFWDRVQTAIDQVLGHAAQHGVRLGFENRDGLEELPFDDDFPGFLAGFRAGAPIGYWHDSGHADIKEGMGVLNHRAHLQALAPRTLGFHLHDVDAQSHDHQPIGTGRIDFSMVSQFWRPDQLLTLELGPRSTTDDVRRSKEQVEALIAENGLGAA